MLVAGIDAGSRLIKAVIWDAANKQMVVSGIAAQGVAQDQLARDLYANLLKDAGLAGTEVARLVATGYGRHLLRFSDTAVTEISCHARGVRHLIPEARTIVEIGGQDSKTIHLDAGGAVRDFSMNDRCAAGTGRFLEVVAQRFGVEIEALGALAASSRNPAAVSSMCVVFAETEIVGLLASGASAADVAAGVQRAMAQRVAGMAGRDIAEPVIFTGGVALAPGMAEALEAALGKPVRVSPSPFLTGALGAALIAGDQAGRSAPGALRVNPSQMISSDRKIRGSR